MEESVGTEADGMVRQLELRGSVFADRGKQGLCRQLLLFLNALTCLRFHQRIKLSFL